MVSFLLVRACVRACDGSVEWVIGRLKSFWTHQCLLWHTAKDLAKGFHVMWNEFHTDSLWAYQVGKSSGIFERDDFYKTHQNLRSLGVDYGAIAYCIRLRHEDRAEYERKARDFYAKMYPDMPYLGLLGILPGAESILSIGVREPRPYY